MAHRNRLLVSIIVAVFAIGLLVVGVKIQHQGSLVFNEVESASFTDHVTPGSSRFAVLADTQRTSWMEKFLLREVNDSPQQALLAHLQGQLIDFLVMPGDLVFNASDTGEWQYFDYCALTCAEFLKRLGALASWWLNKKEVLCVELD